MGDYYAEWPALGADEEIADVSALLLYYHYMFHRFCYMNVKMPNGDCYIGSTFVVVLQG